MKLDKQFPNLEQFFGSYFHEDWMHEYSSEEAAIKDFVSGESMVSAEHALRELNELLSLNAYLSTAVTTTNQTGEQ